MGKVMEQERGPLESGSQEGKKQLAFEGKTEMETKLLFLKTSVPCQTHC